MNMISYFNGQYISEEQVSIKQTDRGFTLGDGVFDTLLIENGKMKWAKEHFTRLHHHASVIKINLSPSIGDLQNTAQDLLKRNKLIEKHYALRTTITRGSSGRGLTPATEANPTIVMKITPVDLQNLPAAITLIISQISRRNEYSPLSQIKSLNYGDNILALIEAQEQGADDAILLNTAGNIACTTAGNIFIREEGKWLTPPLSEGVMNGVTRDKFITDKNVKEEIITPERLHEADEIFVTNSIKGVMKAEFISR